MKQLAAIALALATLFVATARADTTQTQSYTLAGSVAGIGVTFSDGTDNVGGVFFPANGEIPTHLAIDDASGSPVYFTACQDQDANLQCDAGEPSAVGCGEADLSGFDTVTQISVFVNTVPDPTFTPRCLGVGTSGTVTLTTVTPPPAA